MNPIIQDIVRTETRTLLAGPTAQTIIRDLVILLNNSKPEDASVIGQLFAALDEIKGKILSAGETASPESTTQGDK